MESTLGNVVLLCEGCGERTVLGGPLSVWRRGITSFECECGAQLTLADQIDPADLKERFETRAKALYR
ncbi:MAG TPA: hypothetical protein VFI90_18170 [Rubrobacter sp.]|nr:hypothetical protein [Rubrobacter sp.]